MITFFPFPHLEPGLSTPAVRDIKGFMNGFSGWKGNWDSRLMFLFCTKVSLILKKIKGLSV